MSAENNGKRIATIIVIIICYYKLDSLDNVQMKISSNDSAEMLEMLVLKPDIEANTCRDFNFVESLLGPATSRDAIAAFQFLCSSFAHVEFVTKAQWLYALPLIHFLKGECKPFAEPVLNPEKLVGNDLSLPLFGVEESVQREDFR